MNEKKTDSNMTEDLLVVATLKPVNVGDRFDKVPLHVTVLPWFNTGEKHNEALDDYLRFIATTNSPIEIVGQDEAMFGPKYDTRVRKVASQTIMKVHEELLRAIEGFDAELRESYVGQDYAPHVTYLEGISLAEGEHGVLNALQLFSRIDAQADRVVRAIYLFEEN